MCRDSRGCWWRVVTAPATVEQVFEAVRVGELIRDLTGELARRLADGGSMAVGVAGLDDEALCAGVVEFEQLRRLIDVAEGHLLAELESRGCCDELHGLSTKAWLAREAMLSASVARGRVKVATALAGPFPEVRDALVSGRISSDHARAVVDAVNPRVAGALSEIQDEVVNLAAGTVFETWRRQLAGLVELLDQDGGHDPGDDLAANKVSLLPTFDGIHHLTGTLVGEHAQVVTQVLDRRADELFHRYRTDRDHVPELPTPPRSTLVALALVEICRQAQGVDLAGTRAPRTDVSLVINAEHPNRVHDPAGVRLADGTVRVLLCDPDLVPVVVDHLGVPLDMGRTIRYANTAQRRAMAVRDGGCVFPGCTAPPTWCDAHHLDEYHLGGATNVNRLVSLCRHHHGIAHRNGWTLQIEPNGWAWWQTPTGHTFWAQRHHRQHPGPAPPATPAPGTGTETEAGPEAEAA
jgi:hypothetical protein